MGRARTVNSDLPPYVDFYHGSYYYRGRGNNRRRINLGSDRRTALARYELLCKGLTEEHNEVLAGVQYLYVLSGADSRNPVKIGVSKNLPQRLSRLQTANHLRLVARATYLFPALRAKEIEALAHAHFESSHVSGEWFRIDAGDVSKWIESTFPGEALAVSRPR